MSEEQRVLRELHQGTTINETSRLHTSTPKNPLLNSNTISHTKNIMDFSLVKFNNSLQIISGDSGYVSNTTESFTSTTHEEKAAGSFIDKSPYISEDALLEKPESAKKERPNQDVYREFAHLSSLNSSFMHDGIVNSVLAPETPEVNEECPRKVSPEIGYQLPICVGACYDNCSSNKENISIEEVKLAKATPKKLRKSPRKRKRSRSASLTPAKPYVNPVSSYVSPDLFSDEEPADTSVNSNTSLIYKYETGGDHLLLKKVNKTLVGVPPPHCLTVTNITVNDMLDKLRAEENCKYFWDKCSSSDNPNYLNTKDWPDILMERQPGLCYNHSKIAEDLESLFMKYVQRYVGAETQSSCTVFDVANSSPSKRKANRLRWAAKSPGRRLSHLARRRITFSSANLQSGSALSRQIMVDSRHLALLNRRISPRKRKSPRKTPRKSLSPRKTVRTPKSSTKKRLAFQVISDENAKPSTSTLKASATKRALFKSPTFSANPTANSSNRSNTPKKSKTTPKRALFTSPANKRRRLNLEDNNSENKNPNNGSASLQGNKRESLLTSQVVELSAQHKKKLQWAVYEALRSQNVGIGHEHFRQFASVLARVTRRLLPTVSSVNVGTSERMLRIAKQHVFAVTKGKSMEEIIRNFENTRNKVLKPSGYVAINGEEKQSVVNSVNNVVEKKFVPENKVDRVKKIIKF